MFSRSSITTDAVFLSVSGSFHWLEPIQVFCNQRFYLGIWRQLTIGIKDLILWYIVNIINNLVPQFGSCHGSSLFFCIFTGIGWCRKDTVVSGFPHGFHPFVRTQFFIFREHSAIETLVGSQLDSHLFRLTLLGSDKHYTIGSSTTVHGSRCSILQNGNAFNIIGRNVIGATAHRDTVNNIQRSIGTIYSIEPSDSDVRS